MITLAGLHPIPPIPNAIVTIGTFDGVHFGHHKILKNIVQTAKKMEGKSVVLTFWPHPRYVLLAEEKILKLLSTFEEKTKLLANTGIDYLIKVHFTKEFATLSPDLFIQNLLVDQLKTKKLVIGYDHRFGKNRAGNFEYLKANCHQFGFEVEEIPRQDIEDVGVSSTKIRQALDNGEVHKATQYLGRPYDIQGIVIQGKQIGASIGFPTANIQVQEDYKLIPHDGVYAVRVYTGAKWHNAMLNIGIRPTVGGVSKVIEAHIFNFTQDLYGQSISIQFFHFLRHEVKFESLNQLQAQLYMDKEKAMNQLSAYR